MDFFKITLLYLVSCLIGLVVGKREELNQLFEKIVNRILILPPFSHETWNEIYLELFPCFRVTRMSLLRPYFHQSSSELG